nr:cysteine-rich receptor-like protein kinase [Tanacetum cinerariifolium]
KYLELLKRDFFNAIKHFESSVILARGCNPSFIVLVPKINDPLQMSDYRPISLIGCLYQIISKVLSARLAKVIHKLISANQKAFVVGRKNLDGCLIANEIVNCAKSEDSRPLLISAKVMNMSQHVQEEDLSKSGRIDGAT